MAVPFFTEPDLFYYQAIPTHTHFQAHQSQAGIGQQTSWDEAFPIASPWAICEQRRETSISHDTHSV